MGRGDLAFDVSKGLITFSMKDEGLGRALVDGPQKIRERVMTTLEYYAPRVENYMKTNAPWTDRTGNARNGLAARAYNEGGEMGIILYHQVPYGIWLEVKYSGRYAIIIPTIELMGPEIMSALGGTLDDMDFTR